MEAPYNLGVIVGSTRRGRLGDGVARWFVGQLDRRTDVVVDVIDLATVSLPAVMRDFDEDPGVDERAFVERVGRADGFVVITPEYNHGYPASLKLAIDHAHAEWNGKAVGFVSYGGRAGGVRAVEQLRLVFAELGAATVRNQVSFHDVWRTRHEEFGADRAFDRATDALLNQLAWWALALRDARSQRPYENTTRPRHH